MQNGNVLVVENDPSILDQHREFLPLYGQNIVAEVTSAHEVEDVLARLEGTVDEPHVVIIDNELDNGTHGVDVIDIIRRRQQSGDLGNLVLFGYTAGTKDMERIEAEFMFYKGQSPARLYSKVEEVPDPRGN